MGRKDPSTWNLGEAFYGKGLQHYSLHKGRNVGINAVKFIVFYVGVVGQAVTMKE